MAASSALNNSSIDDGMSLDDILGAADERLRSVNADATTTVGSARLQTQQAWRRLVETARASLPPALRPFVRADRQTNRDDYPTEIAVSIDLPDTERIHYGPWVYNSDSDSFEIHAPWRNTPFEVAGGNREQFGDLLDAIARAREVYYLKFELE